MSGSQANLTGAAFRHEALFYAGEDEFVAATGSFIIDAVAADEPVLVVVGADKIERLREAVRHAVRHAMNGEADQVCFADMADIGQNPARIIPAWHDFVSERGGHGRPVRGIGEPIWPERTPAQLAECHRHEALINLAFADAPAWWLLCPYDTGALDADVLDDAGRNHPLIWHDGTHRASATYRRPDERGPFAEPLPEPAGSPPERRFDITNLAALRRHVAGLAVRSGLGPSRVDDLVLAVSELASNSIRHGGGSGALRAWRDGHDLVVEVRDAGSIDQPLAGRVRPSVEQLGGRGLWLVNHLCDLVEVRSYGSGNVIRVHMATTAA